MTCEEINTKIENWTTWATTTGFFDIALLKIWIQFERYYSFLFREYSLGGKSESGFKPELRLQFEDEEQFNVFLRENNKKFIDYPKQVEKLSSYIFKVNPFEIFKTDATYHQVFLECTVIRNYLAHESVESEERLLKTINLIRPDKVDVNEYLMKLMKNSSKSHFSFYVEKIRDMVNLLVTPIV